MWVKLYFLKYIRDMIGIWKDKYMEIDKKSQHTNSSPNIQIVVTT